MQFIYYNNTFLGYCLPDCVPVVLHGTPVSIIQDYLKRWNVEEGRDYLSVDGETFNSKVVTYTKGELL